MAITQTINGSPLRGTVLVVDDDIGLQTTVCDILQMTGIAASAVGSAGEAARWCDEHTADLVVLDQRLPDGSGLQLAALLKARAPLLPVVLLTGYVSTDTAIAAVGLVDDYLTKPVPPRELIKVVQTRLEQHRLRAANQDLLAQLTEANNRLERTVAERTRELSTARDQAMEASRLKSQFLANMSHEIRTPMNGVVGAVSLLAATALTEEQRSYVDILSSSGQNLLAVINDVLDFSKIEAGHLELKIAAFTLIEPFAETVAMLAPLASGKDLQLRLQTDADLPTVVEGDVGRLRQVVTNLVGNAVKFTDAGQVLVTVSVAASSPGRATVRCEVVDTGIGISESDIPLLFKDFTQFDTSNTRRFGGTGLGLAISDRLVQMMGGEIGCIPNAERGSTFWFTVPFDLPETPAPGQRVPGANGVKGTGPTSANSGPLVLVVEDNAINALILERMLTLLGYRSHTVGNGADALAALGSNSYSAVLMDCQMPVMDGYTTTTRLRAESVGRPRIPVVAITATATTQDQDRCLAAGMDDYLPKPILLERLAAVLERWTPIMPSRQGID
ncbi:MAG: sensor histidine kinase [Frankiales bacterium]|nr:sensor histidine kinase [Frankiales bacterium]